MTNPTTESIIKLVHRKTGACKHIGAVPANREEDDCDFLNTIFDSLEEASAYPFPTAESAAMAMQTFGPTKNLDYEVIELKRGCQMTKAEKLAH